jgi:LL-diaminopimelate aminotransferase
MELEESSYLDSIGGYAFAEVDKAKDEAVEQHGEAYIIDLGVGDPTDPTPPVAREAAAVEALENPGQGYPSYIGEQDFREAVSEWFEKRFDVTLDPDVEITATLGSKQSVFCMPMALIDEGDVVLIPDPGYPPYTTGTKQRGGEPYLMPLKAENDFLPNLEAIPEEKAEDAKMMWLNSPDNPTSKIIPQSYYEKAIEFCEEHEILLCSDEAYSEMYYDNEPPTSLFQCDGGMDQGIVVHSLSKRSNMTNYRIGFVAGREDYVQLYRDVQTNMHSGQAQILQAAATAALQDEEHVQEMREMYMARRDTLLPHLNQAGFGDVYAEGGFYVWAQTPSGLDSVETTGRLLKEAGVNTTPGAALAQNPEHGDDFIRFALIQDVESTEEAGRRIEDLNLG